MEPACTFSIADTVKDILSISSGLAICSDRVGGIKLISPETPELLSEEIRPGKSNIIETFSFIHAHEGNHICERFIQP